MLAEFKTLDGAQFQINTDQGIETWSMQFGEGDDMVLANGKMTLGAWATNVEAWSLEPRTPQTEGPGTGFCTIGFVNKVEGSTLHIMAKGNVPIKDFTLPKPITEQKYEIIP